MNTIILKIPMLFWVLLLSNLFSTPIIAQGHTANLNPEDTFSFIKIKLTNPNNTPYANSEVVLNGQKGHIVKFKTAADGKAKVKVPFNDTYTVHTGENTCMKKIAISEFPYVTYEYQAYTKRFIYFTFNYTTPYGNPLQGEEVVVHSIATGTQYKDTTNANGQIHLYLPFESQFRVSVKYHDKVTMLNPQDVGKEYKVMSATFRWMGSKEKARLEAMMDSLARVSHLATTELLDSLVKNKLTDVIVKEDIFIPIDYDSTEWVTNMLEVKANAYKKELASNPNYLEDKQKAVLAPLYRLRKTYSKKIIVTDITGSMSPYMEQVLLWHALNFMDNEGTKYLFFNDGDMMADANKKIGSTGGLYACQGTFKDFKHIVNTMRKGMRAGYGGDGPENDIEALLAATKQKSQYDEVILVADNFSTMRDISLISKLNVPVRVVVCGVEGTSWGKEHGVSEEYLDLARQTGGSIHTVKEDIYDLAKLKDGETIVVNGVRFMFTDGHFEQQQKL